MRLKFNNFSPFIVIKYINSKQKILKLALYLMEKAKKIKIFIGLFYLIAICLFLYFFFSKFSLQELTSYDFIRENRSYFFELKNSNLFLLSIIFLVLTILWVFPFLGFGSPVALLGGFIFGKWIGTLLVILGLSIGATFIYLFGNYFLKDLIRDKFLSKFKNLEQKFKKSEFIYLLLYRFIGGIPWQLSCLLPTIFNVKINNFFFATLIGIIPQIFIAVSIGSGIEKIIDQNSEVPEVTDIIFSPGIYLPILAFFGLVLVSISLRKFFYKN